MIDERFLCESFEDLLLGHNDTPTGLKLWCVLSSSSLDLTAFRVGSWLKCAGHLFADHSPKALPSLRLAGDWPSVGWCLPI